MFVSPSLFCTQIWKTAFLDLGSLIIKHASVSATILPVSRSVFSSRCTARLWAGKVAFSSGVRTPGLFLTCACLAFWWLAVSSTVAEWEGSCSRGCQEGSGCSELLCCHVGPAQSRSRYTVQSAGSFWVVFMSLPSGAHVSRSYCEPALKITGPFCGLVEFFWRWTKYDSVEPWSIFYRISCSLPPPELI